MLLLTLLLWFACAAAVIAFHWSRRERRRQLVQKLRAVVGHLE